MKHWKIYIGISILCLIVFLAFSFFQKEKPFLFQRNIFDETQYLFPQEKKMFEVFDLSIVEGAFLESEGPPFLVSGRILGTFTGFPERGEIEEYIVQSGDTLSSIAQEFDISLETILWANDLSRNTVIKLGQKLIILPVSGVLHVARKGDTLSQIAQIYKAEVDEIVALNGLSDRDDIFIGDLLIIPGGKMPLIPLQVSQIPFAESYFIFPCQGEISQGLHGVIGNAIDIANNCGSSVVAAASGVVQRAGPIWIGGNRITVLHPNGVVSYYGHLSQILVRPGQEVAKGEIIGRIGNTGYTLGATGCHLHFDIRGTRNFLSKYPVGTYLRWGG